MLTRGDTVGVVAPGFAVRTQPLDAGLARLRRMGYRIREGRRLRARHGYLAGTDEERAADLAEMIADGSVRAIWFARGGYGTARLLDRVPWQQLRRDPKLLIGYSDLTALFNPALERAGAVCLYGPGVGELGRAEMFHGPSLRRGLTGQPITRRFGKRDVMAPGSASGRLIGGNLSVLSHLCGTRFAPKPRGAVLFIEETGEQTYRIDRMLNQLRQAGLLRGLAGVLLGAIDAPPRRRFPPDRDLDAVLREHLEPLEVPVVRGLPAGHVRGKWTLPLGAIASIDTAARQLRFGA
jgi:muramoyltetrapeptide carboxypeptidase